MLVKSSNNDNVNTFFALVKAGLWEQFIDSKDRHELTGKAVDWNEVYRLANEQSVLGVVLGGMEWFREHDAMATVPKNVLLQWIGEIQMLEQRNKAMNNFIGVLVGKMRKEGIYTLLVKGQGVAQCYERPLWRSSGDIDLFLSDENYNRAKDFLKPIATSVEAEYVTEKHLGMTIDGYTVELHGTLRSGLSSKVEKGLENIKKAVFNEGQVRSWMNGKTQVFLPAADVDIVYVFTHILQHFYKGGIGLKQICDWCRLLWTFKDSLNLGLLETRIKQMGLMTEWKAFGALAVEYLGMPENAMPLYSSDERWKLKASRICSFIMEVGNFGHNRDNSYFMKYPYLIRKTISLGHRAKYLWSHARIFPMDSLRFFTSIVHNGIRSAMRGE